MEVRTIGKINTAPPEIKWLNAYLSPGEIVREEIESVLYFSLFWNLFEDRVCNKRANIRVMETAVRKLNRRGRLNLNDYETSLQSFRQRYVTDGTTNEIFLGLKFRDNDRQKLVGGVLERSDTDLVNTVLAMLIIVYRYRNNLFHGEKPLDELRNQDQNFQVANQILMKFLERWRR